MPDIAMCSGEGCKAKHLCYRYTATPDYYQSYFANPPIRNNRCEFFWGEQSIKFWEEINSLPEKETTTSLNTQNK